MKQNSNLLSLPVEIKLKCLMFLSIRDLQSVVRVCRDLREVGLEPQLWRHLTLTLTTRTAPHIREILGLRQLKLVQKIVFESNTIFAKKSEEIFR